MIVDGVNVLPKEKKDGLKFTGTWSVWAKAKKGNRVFPIVAGLTITKAIEIAAFKQSDNANDIYEFHVETDYERA